MSSPFNPDEWPAGYGPRDADAPPPDDDAPPPADPTTGEVEPSPADLDMTAFLAWVKQQLGRVEAYGDARAADKPPWCAQWWLHPEVVERLVVAFQAYTKSLKSQNEGDTLALSAWWVQHWDHHARIIFDRTSGPFRACGTDGHLSKAKGRDSLVIVPADPPAGWEA